MANFSLKFLFMLVTAFGVGFAFLGSEPIQVGLAALFCFLACIAIAVLGYETLNQLVTSLRNGNARKMRLPVAGGSFRLIRQISVPSAAILLAIFCIVVSNFVLESSVANGRASIWFSWIVGPIMGLVGWLSYKRGGSHQKDRIQ